MDALRFEPQTDVLPNTVVVSNTVTIPAGVSVTVNILNAPGGVKGTATGIHLVVNGSPAGQSSSVLPGDTLAVSLNVGATNGAVHHIHLDFVTYKIAVFAVAVKATVQYITYTEYLTKLPFEFAEAYTPVNPENQVAIVTIADNSVNVVPLGPDVAIPHAWNTNTGTPYVFLADYFGDKVQRLNPNTGEVVHTIPATRPFSVHFTPLYSPSATQYANTLIACPDTNKVLVYHGDSHTLIYTVNVGSKPVAVNGGLSLVTGDWSFWVACYDASTVEYWTKTGTDAPVKSKTYTMPAGSGPAFLHVDEFGDCYVSLQKGNKIAKCNVSNTTVTTVSLSSYSWDIFISGDYLYAAMPSAGKVAVINKTTFNSVTYLNVTGDVSFLIVVNNVLWTVSYNSGEMVRYPMPTETTIGSPTVVSGGRRLGLGITYSEAEGLLYVFNTYNDSPNRYGIPILDPVVFDCVDRDGQATDFVTTSNAVVMAGLTNSTTVKIPSSFYNAKLIINSVDRGTSYSVYNGDTVQVRLTTPSEEDRVVSLPVIFDTLYEVWEVGTKANTIKHRESGWMSGG